MKAESLRSVRTRAWALVLAGALAVAGIAGLSVRAASADPTLPPLTPAEPVSSTHLTLPTIYSV